MGRYHTFWRGLAFFLTLLGASILAEGFFFCWLLRDGLGPDGGVPSSGWLEVTRIMEDFWVVLLVAIPLCTIGGFILWRTSNSSFNRARN